MASKVNNLDKLWHRPMDVERFGNVILCNNNVSTDALFQLSTGVEPLVIGKGTVPRVWISAPLDISRGEWRFVINDGVSLHPAFRVIKSRKSVTIHAGGTLIFAAREKDANEVIISNLDLRPIGLNIFGDQKALHIGTAKISESSIMGGGPAFGIG